MDEIDDVVDNLFNQYIPKNKDVAPVPSVPTPSTAPEPDQDLDNTASIPVAAHPDIVQSPEKDSCQESNRKKICCSNSGPGQHYKNKGTDRKDAPASP